MLKGVLGKKTSGGEKRGSSSTVKKIKKKKVVDPKAAAPNKSTSAAPNKSTTEPSRWKEGDAPPEHQASSGQKALREVSDEELESILIDHREWIVSKSKEGKRAELGKCNLREKYLQGALLRGADLRDANLQKAELQNVDFFLADLRGIDLLEATLQKWMVPVLLGPVSSRRTSRRRYWRALI